MYKDHRPRIEKKTYGGGKQQGGEKQIGQSCVTGHSITLPKK